MAEQVHVNVAGKALVDLARQVVAQWEAEQPQEVAKWKAYVREARSKLKRQSAMSDGGELMGMAILPHYVVLMMGRALGNMQWMEHDKHALAAICEVLPMARMNTTGGLTCKADGHG